MEKSKSVPESSNEQITLTAIELFPTNSDELAPSGLWGIFFLIEAFGWELKLRG